MNDDQRDEIESLSAIYGTDAVRSYVGKSSATVNVALPVELDGATRTVLVACALPASYPLDGDPLVEVEGLPRGLHETIMQCATDVIDSSRGSPMLFALVEAVRSRVVDLSDTLRDMEEQAKLAREAALASRASSAVSRIKNPASALGIDIIHSDPVVAMKSTFIAHLARVSSRAGCEAVVDQLYQDLRIARATHNMRAYRFRDPDSGSLVCDNDDDGEDAAGGRLAMLLDAMKAEDVIVVVTRFYGGVLMGPLRFKVINDVARQLIEAQPWYTGRDRR